MKVILELYRQLSENQKAEVVKNNPDMIEALDILESLDFFNRMFSDTAFYKAVCESVGEAVYEELRK